LSTRSSPFSLPTSFASPSPPRQGTIKIAAGKDVDNDFGGLDGDGGGAGWRANEDLDFM
jgi:hypothetical protein